MHRRWCVQLLLLACARPLPTEADVQLAELHHDVVEFLTPTTTSDWAEPLVAVLQDQWEGSLAQAPPVRVQQRMVHHVVRACVATTGQRSPQWLADALRHGLIRRWPGMVMAVAEAGCTHQRSTPVVVDLPSDSVSALRSLCGEWIADKATTKGDHEAVVDALLCLATRRPVVAPRLLATCVSWNDPRLPVALATAEDLIPEEDRRLFLQRILGPPSRSPPVVMEPVAAAHWITLAVLWDDPRRKTYAAETIDDDNTMMPPLLRRIAMHTAGRPHPQRIAEDDGKETMTMMWPRDVLVRRLPWRSVWPEPDQGVIHTADPARCWSMVVRQHEDGEEWEVSLVPPPQQTVPRRGRHDGTLVVLTLATLLEVNDDDDQAHRWAWDHVRVQWPEWHRAWGEISTTTTPVQWCVADIQRRAPDLLRFVDLPAVHARWPQVHATFCLLRIATATTAAVPPPSPPPPQPHPHGRCCGSPTTTTTTTPTRHDDVPVGRQ